VSYLPTGLYSNKSAPLVSIDISCERIPGSDMGKLVVIEACAAKSLVVHLKP
jgi:hypothetical protein